MGEPRFEGAILGELAKLADSGTVRVLDAMVLLMDADGTVSGVDIEDLPAEDREMLGFIETGTRGLFDSEDAATLSEGMVPGSAIVALAIENAWAVPLMNSFMDAGMDLAFHTRIPAPIVEDAMAALAGEM
jgi:hypothetical protein